MAVLEIETDSRGVATLMLNRPDKHNALSAELIAELHEAALRLGRDAAVRVVVLGGRGASFCAGGDLGWMRAQIEADAKQRAAEAKRIAMMLHAINTLPKPVIGRIHGNALGGGVGLACVCDVAVGATGALFGLTETRLGLIPATIGPYVVARIGEGQVRRVFFSSRRFGADEARALGILAQVAAPGTLDAAIEAEVAPYLDCAPGAVAEAKALARRLGPCIDEAVIADTIDALVRRWESTEARDGVDAFLARRVAPWQGGAA